MKTLSQAPINSKRGRRVISLSLMDHDAEWIDQTLDAANAKIARRVTRTELVSAAIGLLRENGRDEVIQILKNR